MNNAHFCSISFSYFWAILVASYVAVVVVFIISFLFLFGLCIWQECNHCRSRRRCRCRCRCRLWLTRRVYRVGQDFCLAGRRYSFVRLFYLVCPSRCLLIIICMHMHIHSWRTMIMNTACTCTSGHLHLIKTFICSTVLQPSGLLFMPGVLLFSQHQHHHDHDDLFEQQHPCPSLSSFVCQEIFTFIIFHWLFIGGISQHLCTFLLLWLILFICCKSYSVLLPTGIRGAQNVKINFTFLLTVPATYPFPYHHTQLSNYVCAAERYHSS